MIAEDVEKLPRAEGSITIVCETDRYDGPIGGIVAIAEAMYVFEWVLESNDPQRDIHGEARLFALRQIPKADEPEVRAWVERYNALCDEATVLRNPHIYPVSAWQRERSRSIETLDDELAAHDALYERWRALPVTHHMYEDGPQFAAIQTVHVTEATAKAFEHWQGEVARALARDDDAKLSELFAAPPLATAITDIFVIRTAHAGDKLCDHRGQRLPADFWMTGRYTIQDLTSVLALR